MYSMIIFSLVAMLAKIVVSVGLEYCLAVHALASVDLHDLYRLPVLGLGGIRAGKLKR
jgi:hypothetical protein